MGKICICAKHQHLQKTVQNCQKTSFKEERTMHSTHHGREILSLKSRAVTCLVDNYPDLFQGLGDALLDKIPRIFCKELFSRLVFKGSLQVPLLLRIVDPALTILDLKSASGGVDNAAAAVLKQFTGLQTLYLDKVVADSTALCTMFSTMHKLSCLEITNSPAFDDSVLIQLAESCPCLKILNASHSGISDKGVAALGKHSLALVALDISYTKVSYAGLAALSSGPSRQTLKELKGRGSGIREREDILESISAFPSLQEYSFNFSSSGNNLFEVAGAFAREFLRFLDS